MTIQDVIDKGYKPGMRIKCAAEPLVCGTIGPIEDWVQRGAGCVTVGSDDNDRPLYACGGINGTWATVIAPAPGKGLQEGDSVECGPAMRAAIIELARELGVCNGQDGGIRGESHGVWNCHGTGLVNTISNFQGTTKITPEEFIARMRVTAGIPKPETIDGYTVEYHAGYIKVGSTKVPNDVVRAIHKKLKD